MQSQQLSTSKTNSTRHKYSATFYVVRGSADIRWRVELPVRHLKARLVSLREKTVKYLTMPHDDGPFPWRQTPDGAIYPEHKGTAIWIRPDMVRATHAAAMSMRGIRTVAEVDDNYLSNPNQNYFMRMNNYDAAGRKSHLHSFATFDGVIYSTAWLRDQYHKAFKKELKMKKLPEAFVCRNHVDADDWDKRIPLLGPPERVRVGWMGSHQHMFDLRLAAPALRLAQDMGCEVIFVGLNPADHDPKWLEFLGPYTHVPWSSPNRYHKTKLNFDIGLIPLVMNKHTLGKSDVKFLEYAMSGVATVAQSIPVYNNTIIHGETGLLAASPDDMAYKMADLIRNVRYRQEMAAAAKQWVLENRTIQGNINEWREAVQA